MPGFIEPAKANKVTSKVLDDMATSSYTEKIQTIVRSELKEN